MVIKNAIVCDSSGQRALDVRIEDSLIVEMAENISSDDVVIDAKGAFLLPSIIDMNVKVKDASLNSKNLEKIALSATKGGVLHVVLSSDSTPAIDNEIALEFVQKHKNSLDGAKLDSFISSINEEGMLSNIAILLKKGAIAPYLHTSVDNNLISRIAEYVKMYDVTLFVKAEDSALKSCGVMREGSVASRLGLGGISPLNEHLHVSKMIEIARYFDIKILFQSIASPRSIKMITQAKKEGVKVECEVSILHLLFCDESCDGFNTLAKIDPALSTKEEMLELRQQLSAGEIDYLTSLHQPHSPIDKEVAFFDAAYGSESIENIMSIYYTSLVKENVISLEELIRLTSTKASETLGVNSGKIEVGALANLLIFDTTCKEKVDNVMSLFHEHSLIGRVTTRIKEGVLI